MIFRNILWILASLSLTNAFTISERFAKQVLSRVKRANAGEETFRRSDLDRECLDEQCSAEEYLEYRVFFLKCQIQKWKAKFLAKKKAMLGTVHKSKVPCFPRDFDPPSPRLAPTARKTVFSSTFQDFRGYLSWFQNLKSIIFVRENVKN